MMGHALKKPRGEHTDISLKDVVSGSFIYDEWFQQKKHRGSTRKPVRMHVPRPMPSVTGSYTINMAVHAFKKSQG